MRRPPPRTSRSIRSLLRSLALGLVLASLPRAAAAAPVDDQRPARLFAARPDGTLLLEPLRWGHRPSVERPLGDPAKPVFWLTAIQPAEVAEACFCVQRFDPNPAKLRSPRR